MSKKSRFSPVLKQCFVTAAVGSNIIGHGCAIGYPAILLPQLAEQSDGDALRLSPDQASWIPAVLGIAQLVGSFVSPPVMAARGRRAAHLAVTLPGLASWFILATATNFEALLAARVLQGLSIGMMSPLRSVLVGEYASPRLRGALLTTVSLAQALGILLVHLLGSLLSWQRTALVCVSFSFASLVMTMYSPESPSWLVTKGRYDECREVFRWLRGDAEEDELEDMIQARIAFEKASAAAAQAPGRRRNVAKEALRTARRAEFYKPIVLMMHAYVMVQFAGGTTMAAYSTTIIARIMGAGADAHFWMIFLDAQRFVSNTAAVFVINRLRRRTMMFATGGLCVLSQLAIAGYVLARERGVLEHEARWVPALLLNVQFFTVATGMLPLPNVIGGEVFPLEYRGIGGTISLATMSASFFLVLKTFNGLVEGIGIYGTYALYAGLLTYCLAVIAVLLPETKGKTLQQIEDEFRGRPLAPRELEEKMSLQSCPVLNYKRKMSRSPSAPILH